VNFQILLHSKKSTGDITITLQSNSARIPLIGEKIMWSINNYDNLIPTTKFYYVNFQILLHGKKSTGDITITLQSNSARIPLIGEW